MQKRVKNFGDISMGIINRGNPMKIFDWHKAVELIKEYSIVNAAAGLLEDWSWTGGSILNNGKPVDADDTYVYLGSTWATPVLEDSDTGDLYECWLMEDQTDWDSGTFWPESALEMLNDNTD